MPESGVLETTQTFYVWAMGEGQVVMEGFLVSDFLHFCFKISCFSNIITDYMVYISRGEDDSSSLWINQRILLKKRKDYSTKKIIVYLS